MAKILVVDDEAHLRRVVSLFLRGRHYEVDTAENGMEAIEKVGHDRPDLIIADIGMPGMDGYELCSRLRRDAATRTIPFIFLTAKDQDADRVKARKIGSDDYLTKPCPLEQLADHVDIMIDRIEQAKKIPLDQIGMSGRLDEVDVLDLVQMLELSQRTGALVLSHGERTASLYFKDGSIVEADIRSPKREQPLFVLLGWKAGRYMFLPDAVPERMPITASLAHLLFEDLRKLEHPAPADLAGVPTAEHAADASGAIGAKIEQVAKRLRGRDASAADHITLRILIVGTAGVGKSELIQLLVRDLAPSHWAATGVDDEAVDRPTDFGLVRLSADTMVQLVSIRAEKRFRPVWERTFPSALGAILLVNPAADNEISHVQAFLRARHALAPSLPVQVIVVKDHLPGQLPGIAPGDLACGSFEDSELRTRLLLRLLDQSIG